MMSWTRRFHLTVSNRANYRGSSVGRTPEIANGIQYPSGIQLFLNGRILKNAINLCSLSNRYPGIHLSMKFEI